MNLASKWFLECEVIDILFPHKKSYIIVHLYVFPEVNYKSCFIVIVI